MNIIEFILGNSKKKSISPASYLMNEETREAKVGEFIKIKYAKYSFSTKGDILKVSSCRNGVAKVLVKNHPGNQYLHNPSSGDNSWSYCSGDYVVLPNYIPTEEHLCR